MDSCRATAHAGRRDVHIGLGESVGQLALQLDSFVGLAASSQTLNEPMKAPDVSGVLGASLQRVVEAKIGSVDSLGLGELALFK